MGGRAARRAESIRVLMMVSLTGVLVLLPCAILRGEPVPTPGGIAWSALAGVSGGLGIATLYRALSTGPAALVAPTSGVVGAAVPVVAGLILEGSPAPGQLAGLFLGLGGIWLVSKDSSEKVGSGFHPVALSLLAGLLFGGFFISISRVQTGLIFAPIVIAKLASFVFAALLLLARKPSHPIRAPGALPLLAGVLDAGGNLFFLLAAQSARMDIAAVISSMYPASTVAHAGVFNRERISRAQVLGICMCLIAVALIAATPSPTPQESG